MAAAALSRADLRAKLEECGKAHTAERAAQRDDVKMVRLCESVTDDEVNGHAERMYKSQKKIRKLDKEMESTRARMRTLAALPRVHPPATNVELSPRATRPTAVQLQAQIEIALLLTNSPITKAEKKQQNIAAFARIAPASPLMGQARPSSPALFKKREINIHGRRARRAWPAARAHRWS